MLIRITRGTDTVGTIRIILLGVSYAYTTGTLIVDMADPNKPNEENKTYPNYWRGVVNGVLDDTESSKVRRFTDSINQLFIQSPYLQSSGQ